MERDYLRGSRNKCLQHNRYLFCTPVLSIVRFIGVMYDQCDELTPSMLVLALSCFLYSQSIDCIVNVPYMMNIKVRDARGENRDQRSRKGGLGPKVPNSAVDWGAFDIQSGDICLRRSMVDTRALEN